MRNGVVRCVWFGRLAVAGGLAMVGAGGCAAPGGHAVPIDWNRYLDTGQTHALLDELVRRHPGLARVYPIGETLRGTELRVLEITRDDGRPAAHKPALYVDGNIHSGELTSSAVVMYLAAHLLEGYGKDERITALLDSRVLYLRPKFNPDGADIALRSDLSLRSTPRPWDDDGDGVADEDPENDLDGDGWITDMRIPDPDGAWVGSARDPRVLVRRAGGAVADGAQRYRVMREGLDDDGDGAIDEDGLGGLDMNRNFPRNWAVASVQPGAGPFPLSEPETWATVRFLVDHPNVTGIVHGHTSGGFVYRLPSASDPALFDPHDLELIKALGAHYTETTGRPVRPSSTHATQHRHGTLISWGYHDRGVIGWVPEYWPGLPDGGAEDAVERELARLRFDDERLGGRYFVEWRPFQHPQLGAVEIGGWRGRFCEQNPPPELLEEECALQVPWILFLAEQSPLVHVERPTVTPLDDGRHAIEIAIENRGVLPTHMTQRGLDARLVAPVRATIAIDGGELVEGNARTVVGHLGGTHRGGGRSLPSRAIVRWVACGEAGASVRITVESDTGGTTVCEPVRLLR